MNKASQIIVAVLILALFNTSCTKSRKAELPEDAAANILPVSLFLKPSDSSPYFVKSLSAVSNSELNSMGSLNTETSQRVSAETVQVPTELNFMFENLPLVTPMNKDFRITFSIDRQNITAYKVVEKVADLSLFERSIALTSREAELISNLSRATENNLTSTLQNQVNVESRNKKDILSGVKKGSVIVPLLKYEIAAFGVVERTKNELKEQTSVLQLKETEWSAATHVQIKAKTDSRQVIGLLADQIKTMSEIYDIPKLDNKILTVDELESALNVYISKPASRAKVIVKLDEEFLNIYEITEKSKLTRAEAQKLNLLKKQTGQIFQCNENELGKVLGSTDDQCVLVLRSTLPVSYVVAELKRTDKNGATSSATNFIQISKRANIGLVQVKGESLSSEQNISLSEERELNQLHLAGDLTSKKFTIKELKDKLNIVIGQLKESSEVVVKLDDNHLQIYEITEIKNLSKSELVKYQLKNNTSEQILNCAQDGILAIVNPKDDQCVLVRRMYMPLKYVRPKLETDLAKLNTVSAEKIGFAEITKKESVGLVSIRAESQSSNVEENIEQDRQLNQLYDIAKVDGQKMTAGDLAQKFKLGLKFLKSDTPIYLRLDDDSLYVYEITSLTNLNETQLRLFKNNAAQGQIISCSDKSVPANMQSLDANCVMVRVARVDVSYRKIEIALSDKNDLNSDQLITSRVPKNSADAKVQILENSAAEQLEVTQALDPDSTIKISDIAGEFFYRRTFEDASNMFLGRTGTSGDMSIVKFELEDERLVVRNQESLIKYTGQGAKDKEEIMSIPAEYFILQTENSNGVAFVTPKLVKTTKEKAQYIKLDWTENRVPNASSPLAFFDTGDCFLANTSQKVTDMDMRLAGDGLLNFSLSGSYTMKPSFACISVKDVNSAYWAGSYQFNYNVKERISFRKHSESKDDQQFTKNMSHLAQAAFNFGLFTIADRVTQNGTFINRDGSEKYMPIVHDFRDGKVIKYYLGGVNTAATDAPRQKLLIEATQQVVDEWNRTFRMAFKGTNLERSGDYITLEVDLKSDGRLGDLDRNYIWFQELEAENGLLGVAQPAPNPRSGKAMAANVIVYTGNTYDYIQRLINSTVLSREYEKTMEKYKALALEDLKKKEDEKTNPNPIVPGAVGANPVETAVPSKKLVFAKAEMDKITTSLYQNILALRLNEKSVKKTLTEFKIQNLKLNQKKPLDAATIKSIGKGEKVNLPQNEKTFLKHLAELAVDKRLAQSPKEFELAVNNAFIQFGNIDELSKQKLQMRSEQLAMAVRFDEKNKFRPGCFMYARNDVNDANLVFKKDSVTGEMVVDRKESQIVGFKRAVMSTLSHELGHAFGLMHNFKASTDEENFEFGPTGNKEKTGRNYSSIMDYIKDSEMAYFGPGPYDMHAIRAGYTGIIPVSDALATNAGFKQFVEAKKIKVIDESLVQIDDFINHIAPALGLGKIESYVHLTKDSFNKTGAIKHFAQCDDGGQNESMFCAMHDIGRTATEIVSNKAADYKRNYALLNYVGDRINFSWPQKVDGIMRNLALFQGIRSYLDETINAFIIGTGRPEAVSREIKMDLVNASKIGYQFFHEVIRNPDANGIDASIASIGERLIPVPFTYLGDEKKDSDNKNCVKNEKAELICKDVRILEAKSVYDLGLTRQKNSTFGIGYDKIFAMQFLLQSSSANVTDDSQQSAISFIDFEQFFLNVTDPSESLTIRSLKDLITGNMTAGFFAPSKNATDSQFIETSEPVEVNRMLSEQSAIAGVIGLFQSKWKGYDVFAESFKVGRSSTAKAPTDRFNVVKLGQNRQATDSRVFYSAQNAAASSAIVKTAAQPEVLLENAKPLFETMQAMFNADQVANELAKKLTDSACELADDGQLKTADKCDEARKKSMDQLILENPEIAKARSQGDEISAKLLKQLRELNKNELLLPKSLDTAESTVSLDKQVNFMRSMINQQLPFIISALEAISSVPADQITPVIRAIVEQIKPIAALNKQVEDVPLVSFTHMFMTEYAKLLEVKLANGDPLTGTEVAGVMMNGGRMKQNYEKLMEVIEKIGFYTGLVDQDTIGN